MKLILLQPPVEDFYDTDVRHIPLGLGYLKSCIHKYLPEIQVQIKDYHHGHKSKTIPLDKDLKFLRNFFPAQDQGPFSTFFQYQYFGASEDDILSDLMNEKPDLVGISSNFSPYYGNVLRLAKLIKDSMNIPIILGGAHISACPEMMLEDPSVDYIIRGEGEKPIVLFLQEFQKSNPQYNQIPNLGYKINGQPIYNAIGDNFSLDDIPFPDFSDLKHSSYAIQGKPLCFIISSRSCPWQCDFCSVHTVFGKKYRERNPESIINEMMERYNQGYRIYDFEDDNLTFNRNRAINLLQKIQQRFQSSDIELMAMNGIAYQDLDGEILKEMRLAGFKNLNLALVSSDTSLIKKANRPHSLENFKKIALEAYNLGFFTTAYFIIGYPTDTVSSMIETLVELAKLPVLIGASMFYLTPGSPIAHEFPEQTPTQIKLSRLTAMQVFSKNFNRDDLYTLFLCTRIINFIKGEGLKKNDKRSIIGQNQLAEIIKNKKHILRTSNGPLEIPSFCEKIFDSLYERLDSFQAIKHIASRSHFQHK